MLSLWKAVEWCLRLMLRKGRALIAEFWQVVRILVWYLRLMVLVMSVGCSWQVSRLSLGLVESLGVVQVLEELLEEQRWLDWLAR